MESSRVKIWTDRLETIFKALLLMYAALSSVSVTRQNLIISFVMWPCFFLGAALIVNRMVHYKRYIGTPYWWLLALLFGAACVSAVYNRQYSFKENVVFLALWAFYFLLLYVRPQDKSKDAVKKELFGFGTGYTVWTEICCLISIGMLMAGYQSSRELPHGQLEIGVRYGRLYGVFTDPNLGAITVVIATLFLVYAAVRLYRHLWQRIVIGVFCVINLCYVAFTDSRSGMVAIGVCLFVVCWKLFADRICGRWYLNLAALLMAALVAVGGGLLPSLVKTGYNRAIEYFTVSDTPGQTGSPYTVDRGYDLSDDISNRRFTIWQSGLEVFTTSPVCGTGYSGLIGYVEDRLPDSYLVTNDYLKMNTMDNDALNVLVANGILGFLPFIVFAFGVFIFCIRRFLKNREPGFTPELMMLAGTCTLAACSMFRSLIFYFNAMPTDLFWIMLSGLTVCCNGKKAEGETA